MNYNTVKETLEQNFNAVKAADVNIDINVTVLGESEGEFSVSVHNGKCAIDNTHADKVDITVGFIDTDTMIAMFTEGANPMSLVMGGKMTVNGDLKKGREIKGLFMK